MTQPGTPLHPTTPQLLKATLGAAVFAAVILLTIVVPSEFGRDPTGIGNALGLTAMSSNAAESATTPALPAIEDAPSASLPKSNPSAVIASETPFATEEMSMTLEPGQGAEIKALMRARESFVFSWVSSGGPVNFDMHGEPPGGGESFSSYWRDREKVSGHGSFIAPFDGTHGWYWRNRGEQPVTVTVKVAGYFEKLYRP